MDSASAASLARELGTSIPRVVRAVERLDMGGARAANGRLLLTPSQRCRLRKHLGVTPRVEGLSQGEVRALAVLSRAPLGLVSARALAARADISPTTASRALRSLEKRGLVRRERRMIAAGRTRRGRGLASQCVAEGLERSGARSFPLRAAGTQRCGETRGSRPHAPAPSLLEYRLFEP